MKQILVLLFFIFNFYAKSQNYVLRDSTLVKYYNLTNEAEKDIINNDLTGANNLYKESFKDFKYPHAKDLYNCMKVALKTKDLETAYRHYEALKCLGQNFSDDFLEDNFKNIKNFRATTCKNTIDVEYKKSLDSLFEIDQYYRKLSKGNYSAYKTEITKSDSTASLRLLKLIQKKGFPNEYNIGLKSADNLFYQKFYYIIWHQLATNNISSQKVNFSNELIKALNEGKIRPDIAGQLLDLNNGSYDYSYFKIYQFMTKDKIDCCYVSEAFLAGKRTEQVNIKINEVNQKRKLIGLSSTEDEIKKNIFYLKDKDYVFTSITIEGFHLKNESDSEKLKKNLIKLNDTAH